MTTDPDTIYQNRFFVSQIFPAFPTESDLELANRITSGDLPSLE